MPLAQIEMRWKSTTSMQYMRKKGRRRRVLVRAICSSPWTGKTKTDIGGAKLGARRSGRNESWGGGSATYVHGRRSLAIRSAWGDSATGRRQDISGKGEENSDYVSKPAKNRQTRFRLRVRGRSSQTIRLNVVIWDLELVTMILGLCSLKQSCERLLWIQTSKAQMKDPGWTLIPHPTGRPPLYNWIDNEVVCTTLVASENWMGASRERVNFACNGHLGLRSRDCGVATAVVERNGLAGKHRVGVFINTGDHLIFRLSMIYISRFRPTLHIIPKHTKLSCMIDGTLTKTAR
jgi:hypothetical protein